mgnify:CR=1 FL=1
MTEPIFVDTNVWVYTVDAADPVKRERALKAIAPALGRDLVVSTQVLAEFYAVVTRKLAVPVPLDDAEAVGWIRKAAQQGDAGAQFNLGIRHQRASIWGLQLEVPESKIEAYKWLRLAAAQGYRGSAEAHERVTLVMTREEVVEGNRRAAALVAGFAV